jgi:hypothetical protein
LIGDDGLHPTVQGYKLLAETFRAAIFQVFEVPPGASAPTFLARPGAVRSPSLSSMPVPRARR